MDNIFKRTSANWVRYDKYEWKEAADGILYLTPAKDAVMSLYNPIKEYEELVLTALGIGLDVMQKKASMEELKQRIQSFAEHFGLLGLMTALPTTPEFITYDAVYLPKNHLIRQETLSTEDYLSYFFPFDKISFRKNGQESVWNSDNLEMLAVIMAMQDKPQAVLMSFQKEYAEPMIGLPLYFPTGLLPLLQVFCIIRIMIYWMKKKRMCTEKEWNVSAASPRLTT